MMLAVLLSARGQAPISQSRNELLAILQKSKPDTSRLRFLYNLGRYYFERRHGQNKADLDSAASFYKKAIRLSMILRADTGYGKYPSLCKLGEVYLADHNIAEGEKYFMQAISHYHAIGDLQKEADAWVEMGRKRIRYNYGGQEPKMYYGKAVALYKKTGDVENEIYAGYLIAGVISSIDQRGDIAEKQCMELLRKYEHGNYRRIDYVYFMLSGINRYNGHFEQSLAYSLKSIKWMEKTKDTLNAHNFYGELALVYQELGETDKSIEYYRKALRLREKMVIAQVYIYRTAGFITQGLIKQHKPKEALNEILGLEKRHMPDSDYEKGIVAQIKAYCYDALNEYKLAEKYYLEMLRLLPPGKNEIYFIAVSDLGKFYVKYKKYDKAAYYLKAGLTLSITASGKKDLHLLFFEIDSAKGDYLSAIKHFRAYKTLSDSLFNSAKSHQIEELQVQYGIAEKEKDIKLLRKDSLIQHNKVKQANNSRNLTLAGILLLVLFIGLLYNSYRLKQKNNIAISRKNLVLNQLVNEKEWLLKEIHHRVKNNLQIVMGLLKKQASYIDNKEALAAIRNSQQRMHSIALIHQKLYQSENLILISLPDYIEEMIAYLKDSFDTGNRIYFEKEIASVDVGVAQAVPLGLILNEAITNAIKYAYPLDTAGFIRVSVVRTEGEKYLLTISDQGVGLPSDFNIEKIDSLGMNLMKGLSKQLAGTFGLQCSGGVTITVVFKIEEQHKTVH